ncbi:hypothetical protein EJ05DRAFT_504863 [Pseudovirgaria hyperparasitica]|uniref:Uncharacterized protein n=1 Tax=Pseudovirgaria hyperparasitica TaxID=470096 RepID=A0A6A6VWZ4_9PEZI|nr:uncharacterized protein EJ05DRAFT_504863 [Pseudovirgaria hyperparasitica]KAF2753777.1 hypothetical protein EJ05DRAFT_504863 [Pseudovirgaria hyperparasitica]
MSSSKTPSKPSSKPAHHNLSLCTNPSFGHDVSAALRISTSPSSLTSTSTSRTTSTTSSHHRNSSYLYETPAPPPPSPVDFGFPSCASDRSSSISEDSDWSLDGSSCYHGAEGRR